MNFTGYWCGAAAPISVNSPCVRKSAKTFAPLLFIATAALQRCLCPVHKSGTSASPRPITGAWHAFTSLVLLTCDAVRFALCVGARDSDGVYLVAANTAGVAVWSLHLWVVVAADREGEPYPPLVWGFWLVAVGFAAWSDTTELRPIIDHGTEVGHDALFFAVLALVEACMLLLLLGLAAMALLRPSSRVGLAELQHDDDEDVVDIHEFKIGEISEQHAGVLGFLRFYWSEYRRLLNEAKQIMGEELDSQKRRAQRERKRQEQRKQARVEQ